MSDTKSNQYHVTHWRNADQKIEDVMSDFLFYLEYNHPEDIEPEDMDTIKELVKSFLGFDMQKVIEGEQEMLSIWSSYAKGELKP